MVTLIHILFYFEMLLEFKFVFLFSFSDSKPQHAEVRIKGLPGGWSCTSTLFLLYSCDLCTFPVPPSSNLSLLSVFLPCVPSFYPLHPLLPPPAAHMQAKKRYLLVSVGAGLLFLFYLWALQIGEFQQQPYQYHQFPQYPEYHLYHQQALSHYQQSPEVYPPRPLPQRNPPRPTRHWASSTQLLEPYLEGGEQEVKMNSAVTRVYSLQQTAEHVFSDRTTETCLKGQDCTFGFVTYASLEGGRGVFSSPWSGATFHGFRSEEGQHSLLISSQSLTI